MGVAFREQLLKGESATSNAALSQLETELPSSQRAAEQSSSKLGHLDAALAAEKAKRAAAEARCAEVDASLQVCSPPHSCTCEGGTCLGTELDTMKRSAGAHGRAGSARGRPAGRARHRQRRRAARRAAGRAAAPRGRERGRGQSAAADARHGRRRDRHAAAGGAAPPWCAKLLNRPRQRGAPSIRPARAGEGGQREQGGAVGEARKRGCGAEQAAAPLKRRRAAQERR